MVCAGGAKNGEGLVIRLSMMMALLAIATSAAANMADQAHRAKVAGIDLITYRTNVKDVVIVIGVLPAGDAMVESGNIAIPTLSGMMLDRGTKSLDKFSIAEKLENVGAEISFTVGVQSLEIRAKCLRKDLPLIIDTMAAELRTPALLAGRVQQVKGAVHRRARSFGAGQQRPGVRSLWPGGISGGSSEPPAHLE